MAENFGVARLHSPNVQNPKSLVTIFNVFHSPCHRREIVLSSFLTGISSASSSLFHAFADESPLLERYTHSEEVFTFLKPSSWVDKAGATALFEEPNEGRSNNVGVMVSLVRFTSLGEFGIAEFVADKLIQAEKRKGWMLMVADGQCVLYAAWIKLRSESTKDTEVMGFGERSGKGGLEVYERLTRGSLYLLNIMHSDKQESLLDARTRTVLEQVLHSFDAASMR